MLAAWHAGWALALALLAVWSQMIGGDTLPNTPPSTVIALALLVLPGLAGLSLLGRDTDERRSLILSGWALATLAASALTAGLTGPLAGLVFTPLAAGLALGGHSPGGHSSGGRANRAPAYALAGALAAALAALVGFISVRVAGPGEINPALAAAGAIITAAAAGLGFRLGWRDRQSALDQALSHNARAETLLAAQPGLTLVLDAQGAVLAAYGSPPPAMAVDPLFETGLIAAAHAPDRPGVLAALDKALRGQTGQTLFAPHQALDRRVSLTVRRLNTPSAPPRLIALAYDGTDQFARELGLETARAEADAQNAGKTRFLANMSHELRTPLNAVIGFSDIMRQRLFGPLPDRYAEYATSIHEAGGHLLDLINDVLDVSKIEAARYELSLELFDAREVVSAGIALVRLAANDKDVALAGVLPPEAVMVRADRRALKQITLNLLSNAIKFTPSKGSVTVTMEAQGEWLEIVVADTGVGIAPEDVQRLGKPFEQAGNAEQRAQGTGLGLSLVRALAELHGGRMSIDSTLGEGAAITVRLPVVAAANPTQT